MSHANACKVLNQQQGTNQNNKTAITDVCHALPGIHIWQTKRDIHSECTIQEIKV